RSTTVSSSTSSTDPSGNQASVRPREVRRRSPGAYGAFAAAVCNWPSRSTVTVPSTTARCAGAACAGTCETGASVGEDGGIIWPTPSCIWAPAVVNPSRSVQTAIRGFSGFEGLAALYEGTISASVERQDSGWHSQYNRFSRNEITRLLPRRETAE